MDIREGMKNRRESAKIVAVPIKGLGVAHVRRVTAGAAAEFSTGLAAVVANVMDAANVPLYDTEAAARGDDSAIVQSLLNAYHKVNSLNAAGEIEVEDAVKK